MRRLLRAIGIISSLIGITFSTAQTQDTGASASKEQDAIFRVVVHPGVLTSSDIKRQYDMRISNFYKKWHEIATAVAIVGNKGKPISFGNIELYGAIPVLGSHHDISSYTLNLFVKNSDGCYYQKGFTATPLDV